MTKYVNNRDTRKIDLELDRERRNHILDASLHCFLQLGYANTSMDDVARKANLSRPLIYLKFKSKQHLSIAKRKIVTSVDINDVGPVTDKADDISAGTTKLSEELRFLFQGRNLAFLATLSKDGPPHVTPVWAEMVDDLILINTFESSAKNKHKTNDKRIALSVVEQNNPFRTIHFECRLN